MFPAKSSQGAVEKADLSRNQDYNKSIRDTSASALTSCRSQVPGDYLN